MNGTSGTYLSIADNPALSVGTNQSFTIACWVYCMWRQERVWRL